MHHNDRAGFRVFVVGICGSLRRGSYTRLAVQIALQGVQEVSAQTRLIDLKDYQLVSCDGKEPDVALVHATWEWPGFTLPSGEEAKDFKGIITMVMVKQADTWLIRALQNTMTSAPPHAAMQASSMNTNHAARYNGVWSCLAARPW